MIGISTLAYSDKDLAECLSEIEKNAPLAEIFSEGIHDVIHSGKGDILSSFSLSYSIHAPTQDINLAAVREAVRKTGVGIIQESAEFCMNHDIDVLVVHPGYTADKKILPLAYKSLEKSISDLQKIKEETGVQICIENMPNAEIYLFKAPNDIDLKAKDLGLALDIGHAQTSNNLNEFLQKEIAHYHIHDNHGDFDAHLSFGEGVIGFPVLEQIVQKAKKEGATLIAENRTGEDAMKTVEMLKKAGAR